MKGKRSETEEEREHIQTYASSSWYQFSIKTQPDAVTLGHISQEAAWNYCILQQSIAGIREWRKIEQLICCLLPVFELIVPMACNSVGPTNTQLGAVFFSTLEQALGKSRVIWGHDSGSRSGGGSLDSGRNSSRGIPSFPSVCE